MKKYIAILILTGFVYTTFGQEADGDSVKKVRDFPVPVPWESSCLIDHQTSVIPAVKTLTYLIQHKFGNTANGISDLYGIYAPGANIRLGINYVMVKNFQIGYGITKKNKYSDFNVKWAIFDQTSKNTMPVAVTFYGNMAIDSRDKSAFGIYYDFEDRLSYFSELIIGRKFNNWLSLQAAGSFTHFTSVPLGKDHDIAGLHFGGRMKFSPQSSFIFTYDVPLEIKTLSEQKNPTYAKPNLAFGVEISTSTHAFQIYMGSADGILSQDLMMNNLNDGNIWNNKFSLKNLAIGFTITRLWFF